jgi:hypothetical protein
LERDDKILLYFPKAKGFNLIGVLVANNQTGLDGGFEVTVDTSEALVGIQRDSQGIDLLPNHTGSFRIAIVGNPSKPGPYRINIITQRGNNPLNQGEGTVFIKAGPLDYFLFSPPISKQIAGRAFNFTIIGKDRFNNNVSVNDSVLFSDNTATLTPKRAKMNNDSLTVKNATITKAQSGVAITATAKLLVRSGISNGFNVNQIKILSIEAPATKVSRGQTNLPVSMTVQNIGADTVRLDSAKLVFTPLGYTGTRLVSGVKIPGHGAIQNLFFSVNVNATAPTGLATIDGQVFGKIIPDNVAITDLNSDTPLDSWTVQTPPSIIYDNTGAGLYPKQVVAGGFYEFQVPIRNAGGAALEIKADSTTFTFSDADGDSFTAKLDANRGTLVAGNNGKLTLAFRRGRIPENMQQKKYTPTLRLIGTHNGARLETAVTLPNDPLEVGQAPPLQIVEVISSQDNVTSGMEKDWTVILLVQNNTGRTVKLQNTELAFVKLGAGGGPDAGYQIVKPAAFEKGGDEDLAADKIDSLVFHITQTGQTLGAMAVFAKVFVQELTDPAESNGTQKSILVQTPASLSVALRTSQSTVTQSQTQPWQVFMKVKNTGESATTAIFNEDDPDHSTRISLATTSGYQVTPTTTEVTILGADSTEIVFNVTATGSEVKKDKTIHGQVYVREINSGEIRFDTTADRDSALFTVQRQAIVQVDTVEFDEGINFDSDLKTYTVNTGQRFLVRAKVKQTVLNAETVDTVWVELANGLANNTKISKSPQPLSNFNQYVFFEVAAGNTPSLAVLNASINKARSVNTGDYTVRIGGTTKAISARIQQPGVLQINKISTSESKVRFGRTAPPWYISVPVQNIGGGTLLIQSSQVTVTVGKALQNDYKIDTLKATSKLAANKKDTLKYVVAQTGHTGGTATLTALLNVLDKNSNSTSQKSASAAITVESSALVKILRTDFSAAANRVPESAIALVDTGQVFDIEVTVENTGLEVVDTAYVALANPGGKSQILTPRAKAVALATNGGIAKAVFKVRADSAANILGETFVARLDSAVTRQGKSRAAKGLAVDSTAVARIQLPPRLQLNLSTSAAGNLLTTKQIFTLRAVVQNLGQAQTDASGKLQVALPDSNFRLINSAIAQSFVVGDTVKWQIRAPLRERPKDTLRVKIAPPARSKNSGALAPAVDSVAALAVGTFNTLFKVDTVVVMDPPGAQDRTVSTEQIFTVKSEIIASNNLTNKTATLTLPPGYGFRSGEDSSKVIPDSGKVYWEVQAPTDAEQKSANLRVTAKAQDGQLQTKQSLGALAITAQRRAILNLTPGISAPAGARDGVLAVGQPFTIVATLANIGEANLADTVVAELNTGETGITVKAPLQRTVVFKPDSQVKTITWPAQAPTTKTGAAALTFRIKRLPLDENTGKAALPAQNPVTFNLNTVNRGNLAAGKLRIVWPPGAADNVLSTEQEIIVSDSLSWENATQISAQLFLPPNFSTDNEIQSLANAAITGSAKISWRVRASGQSAPNAGLRLVMTAMDAHNDTSALAPAADTLRVSVQQRADPRLRAFISNPPAAADGVVSAGQPFEVTAVIENNGQALLSGNATVNLKLPRLAGYKMANAPDTVQTAADGKFTWWVQARPTISSQADFIEFNLVQAPRDTNTNQPAASTQRVFQLAVRTEGKTLLAEKIGRTGGPTFRGQTNLPLLRVMLTNPGGPGSSNLVLRKLRLTLRDRDNALVPPNQALKAVRVVHDARRDTLYGEINDIQTPDPLAVNFSKAVVISTDKPDTIAILGDIADNTEARNFRVAFDSSLDFDVADQDSGQVVVVQDSDGKSGAEFSLDSDLAVLFDSEPQKSFYNYPNPLKPGNNSAQGEGTHFTYNLPEASDGVLKIFTLLGELVWETSFSANDPAGRAGGHSRDLFWSGYNGANKKVLNGVYLALLKTPKFGTFMTKVAVVK